MRKKALVTGGAGFIGTNLTTTLLEKGYEVIVFDSLIRRGSRKNLSWLLKNFRSPKLTVEKKDVRDFDSVKRAVSKVDLVFHLAAQVAVTSSVTNPRQDFEVNAQGTLNVLEAARLCGHKPMVIYASTNKVYGAMDSLRVGKGETRYSYLDFPCGISENFPLDFHSPYGCSNGAADQYTRDYQRIFGVPTVVFRQSCIYGPRQMGMEDQGWVAHFAICGELGRQITIYGDGKQVRDILYVDDLIDAYFAAVEKIKKSAGEIYNIGGGVANSLSIIEYLKILEAKLGKKVKIRFSDWRPGDQKVFISDNSKVEKELGWKIKNPYEKGLDKLLDWVKENKRLFA